MPNGRRDRDGQRRGDIVARAVHGPRRRRRDRRADACDRNEPSHPVSPSGRARQGRARGSSQPWPLAGGDHYRGASR